MKDKVESGNNSSLIQIKIEKPNITSLKPLLLSEFADRIDYVQLETSDSCIMPPNINTHLTNDFIFTTFGSKIFQFDHIGKFIRQIGREGQGPGEFKLANFGVDDINRKIFVVSYSNQCPLIFDYDGKYLGNITDSLICSCFGGVEHFGVSDGYFIHTIHPTDIDLQWAGKPYELIVYDYNNKKVTQTLTNKLSVKVDDTKHFNSLNPSLQSLTKCDSLYYYQSFYNDTLYAVNNSNIRPFAIIDFGKNKFPTDFLHSPDINKLKESASGKMRIIGFYMNKDFVFLFVSLHNVGAFLCKYEIATKSTSYHSGSIINDIDGWQNVNLHAIEKRISIVRHPNDYDDKQFKEGAFSKLNKAELKNPEQKEKIEKLMQKNREKEDNPVIMILTLK